MRCLRRVMVLLVSIFGLSTTAFAQQQQQICCPSGCVSDNEYPNPHCVYTNTQRICPMTLGPCPTTKPRPPNLLPSPGTAGGTGLLPGCQSLFDPNFCVGQLAYHGTTGHCGFIESYADKAEDNRTGLACWQRQAKMASQCTARCLRFTKLLDNCSHALSVWKQVFGDISYYNVPYYANIDLCGPPLPTRPGYHPVQTGRVPLPGQ
jgi:hypothetical protein